MIIIVILRDATVKIFNQKLRKIIKSKHQMPLLLETKLHTNKIPPIQKKSDSNSKQCAIE